MDPSKLPKSTGNFKVRLGTRGSVVRNPQTSSSNKGRKKTTTLSLSSSQAIGLLPPKPPLDPSHGNQSADDLQAKERQLELPVTRKLIPKSSVSQRSQKATEATKKISKSISRSTP